MSSPSKKTITKLEAVKERILKNPLKFEMESWFSRSESCGTTCCIGGYVLVNEGYKFKREIDTRYGFNEKTFALVNPKGKQVCFIDETYKEAKKVLGLTKKQEAELFYANDWPEPFRTDYKLAQRYRSAEMVAKVAAKRIDHFIATGE